MRYLTHFAKTDHASNAQLADTLIILLPGAYQLPEDFIEQGFVSSLVENGLPIDLIMAELSFNDIVDETAFTQIHQELVEPAISKGYKNIWLAGISIGGYVAIAYANRYADLLATPLAGLLLLAPYPGNRITTGSITSSGGLDAWELSATHENDIELSNWNWLKTHAASTEIEVYLSYGRDDRFADGHRMMAQILPDHNVESIAGVHSWPVWHQLWGNFLNNRFVENIPLKHFSPQIRHA